MTDGPIEGVKKERGNNRWLCRVTSEAPSSLYLDCSFLGLDIAGHLGGTADVLVVKHII